MRSHTGNAYSNEVERHFVAIEDFRIPSGLPSAVAPRQRTRTVRCPICPAEVDQDQLSGLRHLRYACRKATDEIRGEAETRLLVLLEERIRAAVTRAKDLGMDPAQIKALPANMRAADHDWQRRTYSRKGTDA